MRTFQTEPRKKARKLIAERLMGSSPVWLPTVTVKVLVVVLHGKQITRNDIFRIFGNQCDEVRAVFGKLDPERKKDLLRADVLGD